MFCFVFLKGGKRSKLPAAARDSKQARHLSTTSPSPGQGVPWHSTHRCGSPVPAFLCWSANHAALLHAGAAGRVVAQLPELTRSTRHRFVIAALTCAVTVSCTLPLSLLPSFLSFKFVFNYKKILALTGKRERGRGRTHPPVGCGHTAIISSFLHPMEVWGSCAHARTHTHLTCFSSLQGHDADRHQPHRIQFT